MKNIKCCIKVSLQNIKSWTQNYRMIMLFLLIFACVSQFCSEISAFSTSIGASTNILGVLPNLYGNNKNYFRVIIQLGIILMFSNAPFKNADSLFCVIRTGYIKWCIGQLLYIIVASFLYTCSLFLLTNVCCVRNGGYSVSWGKTFSTLRMTSDFTYPLSDKIQIQYRPAEALLHTLLFIFMLSVLFGVVMFLFSSTVGKSLGLFFAVALVLLGLMPDFCSTPAAIAKISPCSLTQLNLTDKTGISAYPSVAYAYTVLGVLVTALVAANIFIYSNKKIRHKIYVAEV